MGKTEFVGKAHSLGDGKTSRHIFLKILRERSKQGKFNSPAPLAPLRGEGLGVSDGLNSRQGRIENRKFSIPFSPERGGQPPDPGEVFLRHCAGVPSGFARAYDDSAG